jgi:hypothetical protein
MDLILKIGQLTSSYAACDAFYSRKNTSEFECHKKKAMVGTLIYCFQINQMLRLFLIY